MLMRILKGSLMGFCAILILMMVLSAIVVYTPIPYEMSGLGVMATQAVGMFMGGFICSVGTGSKGWMRGLVCGGVMTFVLIILGVILSGSAIVQSGLFKGIALSLIASMAGGITGVNIKR